MRKKHFFLILLLIILFIVLFFLIKDVFLKKQEVPEVNFTYIDNDVILTDVLYFSPTYRKTTELTISIKGGTFEDNIEMLDYIIGKTESFVLSRNITSSKINYFSDIEQSRGYISINVPYESYDYFLNEVKKIGTVTNERKDSVFDENLKNELYVYGRVNLNLIEVYKYSNFSLVRFSSLLEILKSSTNILLNILFGILPFLIVIGFIFGIVFFIKRKK